MFTPSTCIYLVITRLAKRFDIYNSAKIRTFLAVIKIYELYYIYDKSSLIAKYDIKIINIYIYIHMYIYIYVIKL